MTPEQVRGDGNRARDHGFAPIITAELPGDLQACADRLRQAHYPPERNRVAAHVTLFHALPPSCEAEVRDALAGAARDHAPVPGRLEGVMALGGGTALKIVSPSMLALREDLAERFRGLLIPPDQPAPRLHVTVQNKVSEKQARALQAELAQTLQPRDFRFAGLALHRYLGGSWQPLKRWSFRG